MDTCGGVWSAFASQLFLSILSWAQVNDRAPRVIVCVPTARSLHARQPRPHHEKQKSQPTVAITCFRRLSGIFRIDVHVAAETEYLAATDSSPGEPPVISRLEPTIASVSGMRRLARLSRKSSWSRLQRAAKWRQG